MIRFGVCASLALAAAGGHAADPRPNLVLILADDMGYSDIGSFGSEIRTPNLDSLASHGVRFTQFYNGARCCPTRAALMTGLYAHQAGQGWMTDDESATAGDGYAGGLNRRCVTMAEALRASGYATAMVGKWHIVADADKPGSDKADWPMQRGFDRYFGMIHGSANYWTGMNGNGAKLVRGNDTMSAPEGFYTTDNFADTAVKFINENFAHPAAPPLFLYAAFNAPHWPLQAPKAEIDRYRTRYVAGWEALRAERYARQKALGLIDPAWPLSPADGPGWNGLTQAMRDTMALKMAIYAAQVDRLDQNIGKIVAALKANGALDNTLLVFLSDNGGCAEGGDFGNGPNSQLETRQGLSISYGKGWAHASNTPFSLYKHYTREGGISAPFIAHWPAKITAAGGLVKQVGHIIDLMPTFLEAAGAPYPKEYQGHLIQPLEGQSLLPAFAGGSGARGAPLFWEHEGNKAARDGKWKLVANAGAPWSLFDMEADRTETKNLAVSEAARVAAMDSAWNAWAVRALVPRKPVHVATRLALVAPEDHASIPGGAPFLVLWGATSDSIRNVRLQLQLGDGAWTTLADNLAQTGSWIWDVPGAAAASARIRIASMNGKWADTTGSFAITKPVALAPAAPASRILWRAEAGGIRFLGVPPGARLRVLDLNGRQVWSAVNEGAPILWKRGTDASFHAVEISAPGRARALQALPWRMPSE